MTKWETVKLGDVCNITMGTSPKGEDINTINGIPFFQGSAEFGNRYPAVAKFTTNPIRLAKKGDILFSVRAPVGDLNIANIDCCIGRGLCAIRSIDFLLQRFVEYALLFTKNKWSAINDSGSVFGCAKRNDLLNFEIPWTKDVSVLKRVVGILGALDDKIEVLREQNKTLEQMAQAVFQSWFVDFDIVRAKAAGLPAADVCKKYHITPDIYDLFPSTFSADNLPLGWEKKKLGDVCRYSKEKTDQTSIETYISTDNMNPNYGGIETASSVPDNGQSTCYKRGNILISNIRPYFKKIWYADKDGSCSNDVLVFIPADFGNNMLYLLLARDCFFDFVMSGANGAKMPRGDKKHIMTYPVIVPKKDLSLLFEAFITPFFEKIIENSKQIRTLEQTRDTLLPQLISGKLDVENVSLPSVNDEDILKI